MLQDAPLQALWAAEARALAFLACPIILTYLLSVGVQLAVQIIVGHVSSDALAAAALATMFAHAFGLSIILGAASACDTLCSQAFGARNYARVGVVAYQGCLLGLGLCVLVAAGWWWLAGPFFSLMAQDAGISDLSVQYLRLLILGLPAQTMMETLKKPLNAANMPLPPLLFSAFGLLCAALLGYALVYLSPLSFWGAPVASAVSHWLSLLGLVLYLRNHRAFHSYLPGGSDASDGGASTTAAAAAEAPGRATGGEGEQVGAQGGLAQQAAALGHEGAAAEAETGVLGLPIAAAVAPPPPPPPPAEAPAAAPAKQEEPPHPAFHDLLDQLFPVPAFADVVSLKGAREYALLGAPGALALMVEWGSYESLNLIAGAIGKHVLAAQAVLATTATLSFMPFLGFSVACCIRVGNALGELRPVEAQRSYHVTLAISALLVAFNTLVVLSGRTFWALLFTDDVVVTDLVAETMFILAVYTCFDGIQCVSVGALRGVSLPGTAAGANILSYVVVGLPLAYLLSSTQAGLGMGLTGIWLGFVIAVLVAALSMTVLLLRVDWADKAREARERGSVGGSAGH